MKLYLEYHKELFKKAFLSDARSYTESEAKRRQLLLHLLIFTGLLFLIPFGIYATVTGSLIQGVVDITVAVCLLILDQYLRKKNNYEIVTDIMVFILSALFLYLIFINTDSISGHLWSFIVPIAVIFLFPGKKGLIFTITFILLVDIIFIMDYPAGKYDLYFKVRYTGVYSAIVMVAYFLEMVRQKTHLGLEQKNKQLDETIKELKRKDKQLFESSRKYQILFEQSNDAVIIMNGLKFVDFNQKATELFGYTREEFSKLNALSISADLQPDSVDSKRKSLEYLNLARINNNTRFDWLHKKKDGTEFFADINLHRMAKGTFFATIRDIDSQKKFQKELIAAKEQAEKSDRLKSDFLAQMSHEIRTPINAIVNFSSLLKSELENKLDEDDLLAFEAIESSATRLMRTINLILNISEVESGSFAPVFTKIDLAQEIIIPLVKELNPIATERGLQLIFVNEITDLAFIKTDSYAIYQIILNLIDNAIKYTPKGEIKLKLYRTKDNILLDVVDTGIGISESYLPHMFDKFTQEEQGYSRTYEGNGLGLALVKEYCKIHDIDIQVESHKGNGSKFTLIFNRIEETTHSNLINYV